MEGVAENIDVLENLDTSDKNQAKVLLKGLDRGIEGLESFNHKMGKIKAIRKEVSDKWKYYRFRV
jgi:type IV secretory pathway VirB4 component